MELLQHPTLADSICDIRSHKIKVKFFTQINTLIDQRSIIAILKKHHTKGQSSTGASAYSGTDQQEITLNKDYPDSVDKQTAWLKKGLPLGL